MHSNSNRLLLGCKWSCQSYYKMSRSDQSVVLWGLTHTLWISFNQSLYILKLFISACSGTVWLIDCLQDQFTAANTEKSPKTPPREVKLYLTQSWAVNHHAIRLIKADYSALSDFDMQWASHLNISRHLSMTPSSRGSIWIFSCKLTVLQSQAAAGVQKTFPLLLNIECTCRWCLGMRCLLSWLISILTSQERTLQDFLKTPMAIILKHKSYWPALTATCYRSAI